ncbi:MAG: aspartate aminotransferase [Verrucomicrobia bacterium]|nr:aspartate aminotransferase [Verrucomicrobiota bacterium]
MGGQTMDSKSVLNERVAAIPPSVTLGVESRAKELTAKGRKIWSFAAGEPDFDTPEHIKHAAAKALEGGQTKYCPVAGVQALKDAIVAKLKNENGLVYEASQIVISNGAKHSLYNIFMTICREGEEVIIPSPYWLSYPEMVKMAGGKSVFVHCSEKNDFKMTPEQFEKAITPRTKAVIINSPSNPIGNIYSKPELKALADVALKHGIYMVSDEIYEKMIYDGSRHVSVAGFSKHAHDMTITVNGFSKAYAMTGWRLGYFAAPAPIAKAASALQSHSTSGPNTFAQYGGIEALKGPQDCVEKMVAAFAGRRTYIHERLTSIKGITCVKPSGAFYVLPNISSFGMGSLEFSEKLLDKASVAVVPGIAFGVDTHVRLSYACSMDSIKEGVDRIEKFVKEL